MEDGEEVRLISPLFDKREGYEKHKELFNDGTSMTDVAEVWLGVSVDEKQQDAPQGFTICMKLNRPVRHAHENDGEFWV
jgi:hypothetical protein